MTESWSESVGQIPYKVTAFENTERAGVLYLRWRERTKTGKNWKLRSLGKALRTSGGRIIEERRVWAMARAEEQYQRLIGALPPAERAEAQPLTLKQGLEKALNRETGKYPDREGANKQRRREVIIALQRAMVILGADTPWAAIRKSDIRKLWRLEFDRFKAGGDVGVRGTEVTVSSFLAVASWLRSEEHIPESACIPPKQWKKEMKEEMNAPEPRRPRHTAQEMRAILAKAPAVDPRFGLLMELGAEYRLGQVRRCWRRHLNLERGMLEVRGRGRKKGAVIYLTADQIAAATAAVTAGYLREMEASKLDYPLFPAGQLTGGRKGVDPHATARHREADPITLGTISDWFVETEALAEVPHVEGRGPYGIRRAATDEFLRLGGSAGALQEHGGWSDTQMPERIYREQERGKERGEARDIRADIRKGSR